MGDPGAVQPVHLGPQPPEKLVADPLGRELIERAAVHPFHGQQHGPVSRLDHPVDPGDTYAGAFRQRSDESLVLNRLDKRGRGPRVADVAEPGEPVRPVQQVGVTLIRADRLDEQMPPGLGDREERAGALRRDVGRGDGADRQAGGPQRRGDPVGSYPPVRHAEGDQHAGSRGQPDGEREDQLHRQHGAGQQSRRADRAQHDPRRPPPRAAQPRRGRHRDSHHTGQQRRAGERRAGEPRAVPEADRHRARMPGADQVQDPRQHAAGHHRAGRQADEQAEPAAPECDGHDRGGGHDECHLHQSDQQPPGRVSSEPGHGRRVGADELAGASAPAPR